MKKLSIAILILAFMVSCSNKENDNTKNANNTANQTTAYVKPQNPQDPTVALNLTDFKIDNDFILYQGAPFTGKITFDTFYESGYFFVKNGKLEGESEINYKMSGFKRKDVFQNNIILSFSQIKNGIATEFIYEKNDTSYGKKVAEVRTSYGKNSYIFNIANSTGKIEANGKKADNITVLSNSVTGIVKENGSFYKIIYSYSEGKVTEEKYKLDSKADKSEVLVEKRLLEALYLKPAEKSAGFINEEGIEKLDRIMYQLGKPGTSTPTSGQPSNPNATVVPNTAPQQNQPETNQNDDDLAILDRVYDEVMHKNNMAILNTFSKEKLGYIRNTLFAKKGYKFKNPKYSSYFSQKSWYNGIYDSDEILNPEEKRFVLIIKEREK
ncbi:hypothetical protein JMUB3933_0286 [Leptotrichia wadei]|uniref:YARHG domain-containing protein n=1 Tax=Leptotrichia wadei TaxID=157687 RepID=A0A510K5E3_9FUSO|nr:YARHG domain-containing protein [Leptotrichia wadei]BBM46799.1 hypothetical protein JMUB3933_0286 [Leptotrichia wadei]